MATDEILSAFVNSNRLEMTLIELRQNFRNHVSNVELIQFLKQSNLFEVQSTNLIVKLNPKVNEIIAEKNESCFNISFLAYSLRRLSPKRLSK